VQFISSKKAVDAVPDNNEQVTDDEIPFWSIANYYIFARKGLAII
jgi:hypothetical protein